MRSIQNYILQNDIKALLFDLNGTVIDDVGFHIEMWYKIINELGKPYTYEETKATCYGSNEELVERVFPGVYTLAERSAMGLKKEAKYREEFLPFLQLIDGFEDFLNFGKQYNLKLAIGSAANIENVDFVLDNLAIRSYFDTIVCSKDVSHSKPHPEIFQKCGQNLNIAPHQCLVFEDVPKGVESAVNAGMKAVVIKTTHAETDFDYLNDHIVAYTHNYLVK